MGSTDQMTPLLTHLFTTNEPLTYTQELEIRAAIASAEGEIEKVSQRIHSYRTLLSSVRRQADEIWMEIFDWYAALCCTFTAAAPESSALVLGQVCRRWRAVALSMPWLWNHLPIVHITRRSVEKESFKEGFEELLLRSGRLPLKLHLSFEIPVDDVPHRPYNVLKPFLNCSERWEHLTVSGLMVMQTQVHLGLVYKNIPRLSSLTLNFVETSFDFVTSLKFDTFRFAPKLTRINLHSPSTADNKSHLYFPWGQLTSYKEIGVDMGTFATMLESEHLETLQYKGRNFVDSVMEPSFHFILRHLIIEIQEVDEFWQQLESVTLPALETFSLRLLWSPQESPQISTLQDLIIRSNCSLKKLVLDFRDVEVDGLASLFPYLSHLESLDIGAYFFPDALPCSLVGLIFERGRTTLLPRLHSLTLRPSETVGDTTVISQIAASRTKVFVDDAFPGRLLAPLEHVRIVIYDWVNLCRCMNQVGGWELELAGLYYPGNQLYLLSYDALDTAPEHYVKFVLSHIKKHHRVGDQNLAPGLLSLFTLTHFVGDTRLRQEAQNHLKILGVIPTLQTHMLQNRWVPGCREDILYVHPDRYNVAAVPGLWEAIANTDLKHLYSLLGYHLVGGKEDDLTDEYGGLW